MHAAGPLFSNGATAPCQVCEQHAKKGKCQSQFGKVGKKPRDAIVQTLQDVTGEF